MGYMSNSIVGSNGTANSLKNENLINPGLNVINKYNKIVLYTVTISLLAIYQ